MKDFLNKAKTAAGDMVTTSIDRVTEAAKNNRPTADDVKRTADFLVDSAGKAASELGRLGKDALRSDLAKDAAAGAAIGAVVALPIPLVGSATGAIVGAGLGVYKNIRGGDNNRANEAPPKQLAAPSAEPAPATSSDRFEDLAKLHDLKVKGILTEEEFAAEKKKILDRQD
jgi:hypothetical protein